jgi:hypothetical protein
MGRGVARKTCLAAGLVWALGSVFISPAMAQSSPSTENSGWDAAGSHFNQPETQLVLSDPMTVRPAEINGDIPRLSTPGFILQRIAEHREFVQPFLVPAVFPEFSVRLLNDGGYAPRNHAAELDQLAYVSFYYFDLYAPLLTLRDSTPTSNNHFRLDAKIPITFDHQAVTLFIGGNIPTNGVWTDGGGFNTLLGYVVGSDAFSIQARAGFGFDQLIGELDAPQAASAIGDITAAFSLGSHASLLLEADGRKLLGQPGGTLRFWPGFRFFPLEAQTLSFAVGAQWWLDSFDAAGHFTSDFGTRRIGGFVDVGYVFF